MSAPDIPPPPRHTMIQRPLHVHLHIRLVTPEQLQDGVVVVIDALRASVTIAAALSAGAAEVIPALTIEDARAAQKRLVDRGVARERVILGGERGGVLIPGFDLDNSPSKYTRERVLGKPVVFTTTNGTAALLHARRAESILVGSFANLSAVCDAVARDLRPVHLLCCGTRDDVSLDDVLPAGAMVDKLIAGGRELPSDDSARIALEAWRGAGAAPGGIEAAMLASRGGRNLAAIGLADDVRFCSRVDTIPVVPRFDPATGMITKGRP